MRIAATASAISGLLAILLVPAGGAAADPGFSVSLDYEVPPASACPAARPFADAVARHLGYDPFRDQSPLRIAVRVAETPRGIEGVVDWRDADGSWRGERRFLARDGNCSQLLVEMSFSVGFQIQFLRSGVASALPPPVPQPPAAPRQLPSAGEAAPPASPWLTWVGAGPSVSWAMSPSMAAAFRGFLGVRRKALSLELGALATLPSTSRQPDGSGFRQSIVAGSAAACGHLGAFSACALAQVGGIRATGFGIDQPRTRTGLLVQAGLRLSAGLALWRTWLLMPHVDVVGVVSPWRIEMNEVEVWRMPRLGVAAGIDLAVRFP